MLLAAGIAGFAVGAVCFDRVSAASVSLQEIIDRAQPGAVVTVPAGKYEGPIRITKPIVLQAEGGVEIASDGSSPVLSVLTDRAVVRGMTIVDNRINAAEASVVMKGNHNIVEDLVIETMGTGVQLRNASDNTLRGIRVIGMVTDPDKDENGLHNHSQHAHHLLRPVNKNPEVTPKKGNGIDLKHAHRNQIVSNRISNVFDGIYVENSNDNRIEQNVVENSRYGFHLMSANATKLLGNTGSANMTGAMLMESDGAVVQHNRFVKQRENPNAQGILLYDVTGSQFEGNRIEGNRVGVYVERSTGNRLEGNEVTLNFVGMQLKQASGNAMTSNHFVANVIQAQAQDSTANTLEGNYWDDMQGIDLDADGRSNIPYQLNPFFLALTDAVPPYQIFFQAPGFVFLEGLFTAGTDASIRDGAPLLAPAKTQTDQQRAEQQTVTGVLSVLLLSGSCLMMYRGVRRT
ncbi:MULTISPECIES: nitrous oxide reductase family maturation protein NosD [Bacillales]|jgi:nitrous oxidase accessory protein|uniref:ABC transporter substrate-binding protein n=1 Tax=Brevibacillus aydinogluensis TaxID=927786 RepID=A0AA48M9D0_9BACL|nr:MULTISPECIES: NosD domain-containing protein [Bacillales]REK68114.1 MAG: ABC transporter substrate-binding protein [Brevibacillus sp.]MBR8661040.1 right-handed parallel beta-helix repeat-containing protein [Brevibacillus sp. NL20B1]MDT3415129.1 nitrous oxidase accessory protein [Brevibacillus aydinogluensis]NNV01714.1 ABC transporter substrate-binding protein [Brevibacillus sp. MCWH]UFJ60912.1 right-handed parallel beta-helix repeat-containing protein [Anoxybacillus sediminis]